MIQFGSIESIINKAIVFRQTKIRLIASAVSMLVEIFYLETMSQRQKI